MDREPRLLLPLRDGELAALIRLENPGGERPLTVAFGTGGAALWLDPDDMPWSCRLLTRVELMRGMAYEQGGGI